MTGPLSAKKLAQALAEAIAEMPGGDGEAFAVLGKFLGEDGRPTNERHICPFSVVTCLINGKPTLILECAQRSTAVA